MLRKERIQSQEAISLLTEEKGKWMRQFQNLEHQLSSFRKQNESFQTERISLEKELKFTRQRMEQLREDYEKKLLQAPATSRERGFRGCRSRSHDYKRPIAKPSSKKSSPKKLRERSISKGKENDSIFANSTAKATINGEIIEEERALSILKLDLRNISIKMKGVKGSTLASLRDQASKMNEEISCISSRISTLKKEQRKTLMKNAFTIN